MYSWIPFFTELATKLLAYEARQPELVTMLRKAGVQRGLTDQDAGGRKFPLEVIDPFTFLAQIAKYGSAKRRPILEELSKALAVTAVIPDDFEGLPMATAQAAWFFRYAADRDPQAVPLLWKLFREVVPGNVTPSVFGESLKLRQVGRANLTQGMFCANPESYLPVDRQTRPYLDKEGISASFQDYSGYQRILTAVRAKFPGKRFCEISREAWLENNPPSQPKKQQKRSGARYWLYAPGERAVLWEEFFRLGVLGVGWDDLKQDLSRYPSEDMLRRAYGKAHGEYGSEADFRQVRDFVLKMKPGDPVFVKRGTGELVGFGRVSSEYFYEATRPGYRHMRKATWSKRGEWRIPDGMKKLPVKTLTEVKDPRRIKDLLSLIGLEQMSSQVAEGQSRAPAHWWLNANPKIWDFGSTAVGDTQTYTTHTPEGTKRQRFKYFSEVAAGDLIVGYVTSPVREIVAICEVTKSLGPTEEGDGFEFKKVSQYANTVAWDELHDIPGLAESEPLRSHQGSLFRLTPDEFLVIRELLEKRNSTAQSKPPSPYSLIDALTDLFMPPAQFGEAVELLRHKKNIILQGPPGVGKTFMAKRLAYVLMGEADEHRIQSVQFHQSFSYEDFIQGIRPDTRGGFALRNGLFYRFCTRASRDAGRAYVSVIDEINRGNLSKIFGEAMMLIEADKRGQEVLLAYSEEDQSFTIPPNVHIIGTMNTADRSLAMVDYALRRRFCFVDVAPAFRTLEGTNLFEEYLLGHGAPAKLVEEIVRKMRTVNEAIGEDTKSLGPEYQLGHSYFCGPEPPAYDKGWLHRVVNYELAPLLREYWFDARDKAEAHIKALLA